MTYSFHEAAEAEYLEAPELSEIKAAGRRH